MTFHFHWKLMQKTQNMHHLKWLFRDLNPLEMHDYFGMDANLAQFLTLQWIYWLDKIWWWIFIDDKINSLKLRKLRIYVSQWDTENESVSHFRIPSIQWHGNLINFLQFPHCHTKMVVLKARMPNNSCKNQSKRNYFEL